MNITENGLYSVHDKYFEDFKSKWFCDNKSENRPYYVSFIDNDNITWLIPLSSQVDNYKKKISEYEKNNKTCILYHIGKIMGKEKAFLIGNMFPVSEEYIKKPYTFSGIHYVIKDTKLIKELNKKAKRYILLVEQNKLHPKVDIMSIHNKLKEKTLTTV